jgi:YbaB/EbfC DNA-binding family
MPPGSNPLTNLVDVVVAVDGTPTKLSIRPEAMRLKPQELAAIVLAAMREAHRTAVQQFLARIQDAQINPHTPGIRRSRETAMQIQADVTRKSEQVIADLAAVERRLGDLTGR